MRVVAELERVVGPEAALYIMSNLPVVDWHELATKTDLHAELAAVREEMATKADLRVLAAELRGEMSGLRGEMSGLRGEMSGLRGEMYQALNAQTKWFVGTNVAVAGIALTVAKLIF